MLDESDRSGMHNRRDLLKQNVENADNFAIFELNRKLLMELRNEERQKVSEEKRT